MPTSVNSPPFSLRILGRLSSEKELLIFLHSCKPEDRDRLYSVMKLRLWAHAHFFGVLIAFMIYQACAQISSTLIMMGIGSVSFAFFEVYCGKYADKYGRAKSIRVGLYSMAFLSIFYGLSFWVVNLPEMKTVGTSLLVLSRLLVGIPLAFVNGADTILTREIFNDTVRNTNSTSILVSEFDSYCNSLKYIGIAVSSSIGVLIFTFSNYFFGIDNILPKILIIFGGTTILQLGIVQYTYITNKNKNQYQEKNKNQKISMLKATKQIWHDPTLFSWIVLATSISGFLLYSKYHFELDAMKDLIEKASNNVVLALILSIAIGMLQYFSSRGSLAFRKFERVMSNKSDSKILLWIQKTFESGTQERVNTVEANRIIGALLVIVAIVFLYLLNFILEISEVLEISSMWITGITSLLFYSMFNFLRGFGQQLLKSTVASMAELRYPTIRTFIVSLSTAAKGIVHVLCACLFAFILSLVNVTEQKAVVTSLVATVMICILALLVIGIFAGYYLKGKTRLPEIQRTANSRLDILTGIFFTCLVLSNILAIKLVPLGWFVFSAGAISYAFTYMITDAVSEVYGENLSKRLWKAGIASYFISALLVLFAVFLPGQMGNSVSSEMYAKVFTPTLLPLFASLISFTLTQWFDIWAFARLSKIHIGLESLWWRNIISTLTSQGLDTIIFVMIAFFPVWIENPVMLLQIIIGHSLAKWILSIIDTPFLYLIVIWLRDGENKK